VNLPFKITPVIQEFPEDNRIEYSIKIRAIFESSDIANNVVCKIPVPGNTAEVKIYSAGAGKGRYEPDKSAIYWRIKKFQGDSEYLLSAVATLTNTKTDKVWQRPPITMEFNVPLFTGSGLRVRYLRIQEKSGYKPKKWIRYLSKAGDYAHRI
jgi:AP-2 complex subunit mu-1